MIDEASFEGYTSNPDDLEEWGNALSLEVSESVLQSDRLIPMPVVRVDTNYKSTRTGKHPVKLTIDDTIKAASSLITLAEASLDNVAHTLEQSHDDIALLNLLDLLTHVDSSVMDLRAWLHRELRYRRENEADDEPAASTEVAPHEEGK